jgi:hypothetical protein
MQIDKVMELMHEYNKLIARIKMAWIYMENNTQAEVDKVLPPYQGLVKESSMILKELKCNEIEYISDEVDNGFNINYRKVRFEKYKY